MGILLTLLATAIIGAAYDPLVLPTGFTPLTLDLVVTDEARHREIPVRVYLPAAAGAQPVVLFSHGLGGSREGGRYLGEQWAARGYVGVFLQHPGSDTSVWKDAPVGQRMGAMRQAASAQNFLLRVQDVHVVLDRLETWNKTDGHPLARRLDLSRIGMSGHSFGAITTQAVSGQRFATAGANTRATDARIKAAVIFSPSRPRRASETAQAFGGVNIPWLLMTGTEDVAPIGDIDVQSRLAVFPALPPGRKYELVLDGAKHAAFADERVTGDDGGHPNHHRAIRAVSTAFWDAYLRQDAAARAWLDGAGPRSVLEAADRWQTK